MSIAFKLPRFYPIIDTLTLAERQCLPLTAAEVLVEAGARILQYRHKGEWTQARFDEAKRLSELCGKAGVLFVLNDRADYARLLGAALHIGQQDLPPLAARKVISDEVIGFSTHNRQQLAGASELPVEYLSIGPIFATQSKLNPDPVVGIAGLKALRPLAAKALCAIGGLTLENAIEVIAAGADSVAIISGILPESCERKPLRRRAEEWIKLLAT